MVGKILTQEEYDAREAVALEEKGYRQSVVYGGNIAGTIDNGYLTKDGSILASACGVNSCD